jgi:transposase
MISADKRKAIVVLHEDGMSQGEISRRLKVSPKTVRSIIKQGGGVPNTVRKDKKEVDPSLLRRLHADCGGWIRRIYEKLTEEEGVQIGYSTVARRVRELGIGRSVDKRCERVADVAGAEMQHDTSRYRLRIGSQWRWVVASLLYLRYSKMRYLKFYRSFNRFAMKCFFHEALRHFGYAAAVCIIDNTSLARLRGTGKNAVMVQEMEEFASRYGFQFECHEVKHSDRKAGNERSFFTVETNFFAGRTFESLEDLNDQALQWATVRMPKRPMSKTRLIPAEAFEQEKPYLVALPPYIEPPYRIHERGTDQYGYAPVDGNYYWVPGTSNEDVKVLEYGDCLKMYRRRDLLAEYPLPPDGAKNQKYTPGGIAPPKHQPKHRKKPTAQEEKTLRGISKEVAAYLDFALEPMGIRKHRFIRELFQLYRKLALPVFLQTLERALKYRITEMETLERIAVLYLNHGRYETPFVDIDEEFQNRPSYQEGRLSDEVDLSIYDKLLDEDDDG